MSARRKPDGRFLLGEPAAIHRRGAVGSAGCLEKIQAVHPRLRPPLNYGSRQMLYGPKPSIGGAAAWRGNECRLMVKIATTPRRALAAGFCALFRRPAPAVAISLVTIMLSLTSCSTPQNQLRIVWQALPPLPDREGFAGAFAGVASGQLLVAGGANFPDKKPWEGGRKVWYDTVFALEQPDGIWRVAGKLPRPLGYGISVTVSSGVACIGGSDAEKHHADCFLLALENGQLKTLHLPALPLPLANMGGAAIGEVIYICGGSDQPGEQSALNRFFVLDLNAAAPAWKELEPCPGRPRLLPLAAAVDGAFYLGGGADIVARDGKMVRVYLLDAWRYQPGQGWRRIVNLPKPSVAAPCPAPALDSTIYVAGGDDGSLVGFQPVTQHPGFPNKLLAYDTRKDQWREAGKLPAPRATLPAVHWQGRWVLPSGEVRPGMRSPEVWAMETPNGKK